MLSYKGYIAEVDYDDNAEVFFGTVVNASTIMSFRGASVSELKSSFSDVVETYLADCRHDGVDPEKPFSGKITVRVPPNLHRRVAVKAATLKESMNKYLEDLMVRDTLDIETVS
jgi:predicted HicB family RNase H-like nuclease